MELLEEEGLRGQLWEDCRKGAKESLIGYLRSNTVRVVGIVPEKLESRRMML